MVATVRLNDWKTPFRVIGLNDQRDQPPKMRLERRRDSLRQDFARLTKIRIGNACVLQAQGRLLA